MRPTALPCCEASSDGSSGSPRRRNHGVPGPAGRIRRTVDWLDIEAQAKRSRLLPLGVQAIAAAHRVGVRLLRLDQFLCPGRPDGLPRARSTASQLRYDGIHFSEQGAAVVLPWILDRLFHP